MDKDVKKEVIKEAIVKAAEGKEVCELTISERKALDEKEPIHLKIVGTIDSPFRFVQKRAGEFDHRKANIAVDRERMEITLVFNEDCPYCHGAVVGNITPHPTFKKFGINSGAYLTTQQMSDLFKMNRSAFESHAVAMNLVHELKNFKAKVNKDLEKADNNRGDRKILLEQTVNSNVPEKFNLVIPVFKGMPKETFEVEVYFNPDDLTCTLVSPTANDILESVRDSAMDEVLKAIDEVAPDIVVIEK